MMFSFVLFLDAVWTEDPFVTHQNGFHPPEKLLELLDVVTSDPGTTVYLLSGKGKKDLEEIARRVPKLGIVWVLPFFFLVVCWRRGARWSCGRISADAEGIGISAEHGCFIKPAGGEDGWVETIGNLDMSWRGPCMEILNYVRLLSLLSSP